MCSFGISLGAALLFSVRRLLSRVIGWSALDGVNLTLLDREEFCSFGGGRYPLRKSAKAWASSLVLPADPSRSTIGLPSWWSTT